MSALRPELQAIVERLLASSAATREIGLDQLGEAIGTHAVSYPEVDAMMSALEAEGRTIASAASELRGEEHLRAVVSALRTLPRSLQRKPTQQEIADHAGLTLEQVRHALVLVRIMQR